MKKIIVMLMLGMSISVSSFAEQGTLKMRNATEMNQKLNEFANQYLQRVNVLLKSIDPNATSLTGSQKQQMCRDAQIYFNNFYDLMNQNRNLLKPEMKNFTREQLKNQFVAQAGSQIKQMNCNFI